MKRTAIQSLLIKSETTIKQTMQRISETGEKIVFVVDGENRLIGTITDGDIRKGITHGKSFDDNVGTIMNRNFTSILSDTPNVRECAKEMMIKNKFEQIPVLDHKGVIIDVVLWTDIIEEKAEPIPKQLRSNYVVIMAGGKGSRLDPFTKVLPKPLIPIGDKPVIELIMEEFFLYGFQNFLYTLNYKKEYMKLYLSEVGMPYNISWVEEEDFMGTAGSLSLLKDKINDTFFVTNCDSLLKVNFLDVLEWHKDHNAAMTIIGSHNEVKIPFGVLEMGNGRVERMREKPSHDVIINTGVYVMEPHILQYLPEGKQINMNSLIDLVMKKEKISVYPIYNGWFDIGQWEEYKKSLKYFMDISELEK